MNPNQLPGVKNVIRMAKNLNQLPIVKNMSRLPSTPHQTKKIKSMPPIPWPLVVLLYVAHVYLLYVVSHSNCMILDET